jgi:hypothetical protein
MHRRDAENTESHRAEYWMLDIRHRASSIKYQEMERAGFWGE